MERRVALEALIPSADSGGRDDSYRGAAQITGKGCQDLTIATDDRKSELQEEPIR